MDVTETPEYSLGWEWAKEHGPLLAELFTEKEIATQELRTRLFKEASRRWPSTPEDFANDLRQTAFVAGAFKAAIQTLPMTPEAAAAVMEAAMEMGVIWGSEQRKIGALEELKAKPVGWWRRKLGDATPLDVVNALSVAWRHDWAKERGRPNPRSKWEVLIDTLGARELGTLAEANYIEEKGEEYAQYVIHTDDDTFAILSRPVYDGGRMMRYPGEIVG